MIVLGHHYVAILLAKMLIWARFSQLMCTFSFFINPWLRILVCKADFIQVGLIADFMVLHLQSCKIRPTPMHITPNFK